MALTQEEKEKVKEKFTLIGGCMIESTEDNIVDQVYHNLELRPKLRNKGQVRFNVIGNSGVDETVNWYTKERFDYIYS